MKCVIQRVSRGAVTISGEIVAEIGRGMVLLAAVEKGDSGEAIMAAARKIRGLRIFGDAAGKMNLDLEAAGGEILAVSQFTLAGSIEKGRRPSFVNAEEPDRARALFEMFVTELGSTGVVVKTGRFREDMLVTIENDGPVTFVYDVREESRA